MLILSGLDIDISPRAGNRSTLREWFVKEMDPKLFYRRLGEEMKAVDIEKKVIVDVGAGFGRIIDFFQKCSVFPKQLILIEGQDKNAAIIKERLSYLDADIAEKITLLKTMLSEKTDLSAIPTADSIIFSGVAMYYSPEKWMKIITHAKSFMLKPKGKICFNIGTDSTDLLSRLHRVLKKRSVVGRHTYQIESLTDWKMTKNFGHNYIFSSRD